MNETIKELVRNLKEKIEEIKRGNPKGLTQYAEGKIDGLNYAINKMLEFVD